MDLKQIKELMSAMERAGLKKLIVKQKNGDEIHLERQEEPGHASHAPNAFYPPVHAHHMPHAASGHKEVKHLHEEGHAKKSVQEEKPGQWVTAPLVGTYYSAPSPEDPPFVKVGDHVTQESVVCIIEAMKVMNEVKAGVSGTVAEILIDNSHPVEFGTKMIRIV